MDYQGRPTIKFQVTISISLLGGVAVLPLLSPELGFSLFKVEQPSTAEVADIERGYDELYAQRIAVFRQLEDIGK